MDVLSARKVTQVTEIWSCYSSECEEYSFWDVAPCGFAAFAQFSKFPAFYGTRKFITAFISACHLSLPWASSIQPLPPHPSSWGSIFILSSHLLPSLPSALFPSGFPTKTIYMPLLSPNLLHASLIIFFSI